MFDHEGRLIQADTWLNDLQLYLLSDSTDNVSFFDHTSGASIAPPAIADSATRSQWLNRDGAARLDIRNHLPLAECAHFGQHKTAKALYDAVVTLEDLVTHLRTSNARYRAALPAESLDRNPPRMYITLYFIVTRLPDSLRVVRDHFLAVEPTDLTVDLLEQHLLAGETSVVAVGAARGTPRTPFFEGCSPSPLGPSYASAAAVDVLGAEDVGAASTMGAAMEVVEVVAAKGVVAGVGALVAAVVAAVGVAVVVAVGVVAVRAELFRGEGSVSCPYVIRTSDHAGQTCGKPHTQHRCFSRLDDTWRIEFGDQAERPRWAELLRSGVAICDLDYDAILAAMYALCVSAEGDCKLCVPPDPGIEAAALGASESALPSIAHAEALHTFTLESGASCCFFPDSTTLTPLSAPVPVRVANSSGGPVLAHSSTVLPCPAVLSGSLSGLHIPSFSTNLLRERFREDLPVLRLHSNRGGEFSSDLLRDFCRGEGILQSFTLPTSPQQNEIAERRIGLVMEVAHTSMIHAAAPHFLWPFAVWYAAHRLNLWPHVSFPKTSPTLRRTGKVGDASVFRVWGSCAFVRGTSADKLSARAIPYLFLGFPPGAPGWQFYHPSLRRVLPSQDVMFDKSVPFYHPLPSTLPVEVAVDSGAARGAASGGAEHGGAEPADAEPGGAEPERAEPGGAEPEGVESEGGEPGGTLSPGGPQGALSRLEPLSPPQLHEWFARRTLLRCGATRAGGAVGVGAGGTGAGAAGGTGVIGPRGSHTKGTGAAGAGGAVGFGAGDTKAAKGTGAAGPGGARTGGTGAEGAGGTACVGTGDPGAGAAGGTGAPGDAGAGGAGPRASSLLAPSLYTEQTGDLTECREPVSRPALPVRTVRTGRCVPRLCPPCVLRTHAMALHPSSVPQRVPLPSPPASSLSTAASALDAELVDFAAACCLDYAASLVAESESDCPPSVEGECALGTDVLEKRQENFECFAAAIPHLVSMLIAPEGNPDAPDIPTPRSYAEAITGPYSSKWQTAMDAEMASWKSTGT
ncbi:unnamed protein product [Closterium sp. NIES-53]